MIFVLGAKGFVGSTVLDVLRVHDECIGIDMDNYDAHVGRSCDVLVNANGNSKKFLSNEKPALDFDLSVRSVVRSITDFPAARHVHISSVDVYTEFTNQGATHEDVAIDTSRQSRYGFHKWLAEQYVRVACPRWLILRLGGMVGPRLAKGPVYDLMHDVPLRVHLDSRYQYIPTRTVGDVVAQCVRNDVHGEIFNVVATGTVSLREIRGWLGKKGDADDTLARQHYEVNNEKLRGVFPVPTTEEAVREFLRNEGASGHGQAKQG